MYLGGQFETNNTTNIMHIEMKNKTLFFNVVLKKI